MKATRRGIIWAAILAMVCTVSACAGGGGSTAPITTVKTDDGKISFKGTVQPILVDHCQRCHNESKMKGALYLMTYDGVMKGGQRGPAVIPGDPDNSQLVGSVEKTKEPYMPPKVFPALTLDRIQAIRTWISEGCLNN